MPRQTYYDPKWEEEFSWLSPASASKNEAKCKLCLREFTLGNMGVKSVLSHSKSKRHIKIVESVSHVAPCFSKSNTRNINLGTDCKDGNATTERAEIIWLFTSVLWHHSFRSTSPLNDVFPCMFPDSTIARNFSMGYDKAAYVTCFGLAPYFEDKLKNELDASRSFSISVDESLNEVAHKNQMDLHVRYWDSSKSIAVTRYFNSQFLGHSCAADLVTGFCDGLKRVSLSKMQQISMDGPSVNWRFYADMQNHLREGDNESSLIETGSCGLHIVNNSFKKGLLSVEWSIEKVLRSAYKLFKNSPAKREDFTAITESLVFPMTYCGHRWLENVPVAERMVAILPDLELFVKSIPKSKTLWTNYKNNENFLFLQKTLTNSLILPRLQFFISIGHTFSKFLTHFQTEHPAFPFLGEEMVILIKGILSRFVRSETLDQLLPSQLLNVDVNDPEIMLPTERINVGIPAKSTLLKTDRHISPMERQKFRLDCRDICRALYKSLSLKNPLKYEFVRNCRCLIPRFILEEPEQAEICFENILTYLYDKRRLSASETEKAKVQFHDMVTVTARTHRQQFDDFKEFSDRLDAFFVSLTLPNEVFSVMKIIFTLFHGNANIERGFKVNKDTLSTNMRERTLYSLRFLYDSLKLQMRDGRISSIEITSDMMQSVRQARQRYRSFLDDQQQIAARMVSYLVCLTSQIHLS